MKKILVIALAALMLAVMAVPAFAATPEGQIAYYDFDDETGLTKNGDNVTIADGVVTLGAQSWLETEIDLAGVTEVTVAFKVKFPATSPNWAFEITSQEEHASWVNGGTPESYLGALYNGSLVVERYHNGRLGSVSGAFTADEWHEVVCVFSADEKTTVYVDGALFGEYDPTADGSEEGRFAIANCVGETPTLKIGKANWVGGEYADGTSVDTLVVYNKALTANEVATALEEAVEEEAPVTGVATIVLAVVAMLSGAYIVSKKH